MDSRVTPSSILAEITDAARQVFDEPSLELTPDTTSDDIAAWDSMTHITLVVEIETRFGVEFDLTEIETMRSVGELIRAIEVRRAPVHA